MIRVMITIFVISGVLLFLFVFISMSQLKIVPNIFKATDKITYSILQKDLLSPGCWYCMARSDQYLMNFCNIPKSCGTKMFEIWNYLEGDTKNRTNEGIYFYARPKSNLTYMQNDSYTNVLIVRDPVQRFISGYINKCIDERWKCDGFGTNITALIRYLYQIYRKKVKFPTKEKRNAGFYHMNPQHWYCKIQHNLYNKILVCDPSKDEFEDNVLALLSQQHVEKEKLNHVRSMFTRHIHPTTGSMKEWVLQNLTTNWKLLDCLLKIYHGDYTKFKLFDKQYQQYKALVLVEMHR